MGKLGVVFPGQGTQSVGMGKSLCDRYPTARETFERADQLLGYTLSRLCFEGPQAELDDTANTQPAIYVTEVALWRVILERVPGLCRQVHFVAGHSLGEYAALAACGALDWEAGLRLVRTRGLAMRDAGAQAPGGMAAILGLNLEAVAELVAQADPAGQALWVANHNAPGQVVIAGTQEALDRALTLARERGAKRAVPLAVSVACHTPLMAPAAERLAAALRDTPIARPWAPVVQNATALATDEPEQIRAALVQQLTAPVLWVESVHAMQRGGGTRFIEIGPRSVLASLIGRIDALLATQALTDGDSLEACSWEA